MIRLVVDAYESTVASNSNSRKFKVKTALVVVVKFLKQIMVDKIHVTLQHRNAVQLLEYRI